ncbi:MAG: hypothetical protein LBN01_03805 [Endomicrobium sp.]|jgi:predicted nucleic acid-binding protein|nr:hypothetical protein [Endomicrobium sp.]
MGNNLQSRHYYLIDTSAFCRYVELESNSNIISNFQNSCFYYIPQFCIAEVFNTFAKWYYSEDKISPEKYEELCKIFKKLIRNRFVFYPYDLHRYHNLNCDKIYEVEHKTPAQKKGKLSTFDILILAMAIELQTIHGNDNITILSCDKRILEIAKLLNIIAEPYQ